MKFFYPAIFFLIFIHPSVSSSNDLFSSLDLTYNEKIDAQTRAQIHALNNEIFQSFKTNKPTVMFYKFAEKNRAKGFDPVEKVYNQYAEIIAGKTFFPGHDFLALHSGSGEKTSPIVSPSTPVFLTYVTLVPGVPKYISIMESKNGVKDLTIIFIYEQIGTNWNLNTFQVGTLRIGGKTPVGWYHEAKHIHQSGHTLPAFLRLSIAKQFLRPAPFIHYKLEGTIKDLESECREELEKHTYPISLATEPITQLISIAPYFYQGDIIPVAKYLTLIPLTDKDKIKTEAKKLVPQLEALFPGFSSYSKNVAFRAINELPDDRTKSIPTFDVLISVDKKNTFVE